ncbi:MAG: chemotaxis protein CheA [Bacteriovoracaceae bacterium]
MQDDELLNDFLEESYDLIEKVKHAITSWNDTSDKVDSLNSIYRWVHTIKGGCSVFEYKETASIAHELESYLGDLKKDVNKVNQQSLKRLETGIYKIEASLRGQSPTEEVITNDNHLDSENHLETNYFKELVGASPEIFQDLIADGLTFFEILLPSDLSPKLVEKLKEHEIFPFETLTLGNSTACLCSVKLKENPSMEKKVKDLIERFDGHWCNHPKAPETPVKSEEGQIKEKDSSRPEPSQQQEVLRVPLAMVNSILDHVWELFLVRNQMAHLFNQNKNLFKDNHSFIQQFEALDNVIERNIHEVEARTMSMRLSPIKKIFDRMEKVVKEYCAQTGKDIKLVTSGEGIDLDKKVLDQLNEPLIHLIRNAIDHGIENSEVRTKSGKKNQGTVELSAQLQGNEVAITISDDGKGIDASKILESAKKKNLDVSHLKTEQEIIELIFAPGFSTAEKVTDVSGRGVGMDAVKTSIQELGGNVSLSTLVGKGTKFRINLPLTMSVSKCLIVNVQGIDYAISTKSITFVERISTHALKKNGNDLFYEFNGNLIPCYNIKSFLPDHSLEPDLPVTHLHVCVTNLQGQDIAFGVDEIIQTLNIVLKPLPKAVKKHAFISGVSILPGGSPIFVLNIHECLLNLIREKKGEVYGKRVA